MEKCLMRYCDGKGQFYGFLGSSSSNFAADFHTVGSHLDNVEFLGLSVIYVQIL